MTTSRVPVVERSLPMNSGMDGTSLRRSALRCARVPSQRFSKGPTSATCVSVEWSWCAGSVSPYAMRTGTPSPPSCRTSRSTLAANSFLVTFDAHHRNRDLDFRWQATIQGDQGGNISLLHERPGSPRLSLLPHWLLRVASLRICRTTVSGHCPAGVITGELPKTIGPQRYEGGLYFPLFEAVSSLKVSLAGGVEARFDFEGDLFEMEDQRNWTDGSFKTYCTPLSLGYPHTANAGQNFAQRVSVSASGPVSASIAAAIA